MMGRSPDATRINGTVHVNHNIFLYRAPSWNATYEWVPSNGVNGSVNVGNGKVLTEDPVLWQGRRGFHVLLHSAPYLSHGWSVDGACLSTCHTGEHSCSRLGNGFCQKGHFALGSQCKKSPLESSSPPSPRPPFWFHHMTSHFDPTIEIYLATFLRRKSL